MTFVIENYSVLLIAFDPKVAILQLSRYLHDVFAWISSKFKRKIVGVRVHKKILWSKMADNKITSSNSNFELNIIWTKYFEIASVREENNSEGETENLNYISTAEMSVEEKIKPVTKSPQNEPQFLEEYLRYLKVIC